MDNGDADRKEWFTERTRLNRVGNEAQAQFDRQLLYLASGAIALSLGFLGKESGFRGPEDQWFLVTSWVLFCVAILCTLVSFQTTQRAHHQEVELLDHNFWHPDARRDDQNQWNQATTALNWTAMISFILAVVFTVLYGASRF